VVYYVGYLTNIFYSMAMARMRIHNSGIWITGSERKINGFTTLTNLDLSFTKNLGIHVQGTAHYGLAFDITLSK
jgi:hypothetical protein